MWIRIKAWLVWLMVRMLLATVRIRIVHLERLECARRNGRPILYAFWHGLQLVLLKANPERGKRLAVMTSLSRDGRLQASIMSRFGLEVVRGSSSRGGLAGLVALTRLVRSGAAVAMAVDGPRGPLHQAKPGILALARQTGSPIVPISVGFSKSWELRRAWDRFRIPKPFAVARVVVGEMLLLDRRTPDDELGELSSTLSGTLRLLTDEANGNPVAHGK